MIMQWKKQPDGHSTARWQGIEFTLYEQPDTKRWHLLSDGKQVKETWRSYRAAVDCIENRQQRLILAVMNQTLYAEPNLEPRPAKRTSSEKEAMQAMRGGATVHREHIIYEDGRCRERFVIGGPIAISV